LPLKYFEQRPTGTLVARLEGVETIRNFLSGAAVTLVLDLPFLFIFLAVMFYYSWQLTLIVVGCLTAIALISLFVAGPLRRRLNEQFQLGARNQAFLTEYINGAETVKSLQMEPQMRQRFGDYLSSYLGAGFRTRSLFNTYNVAANTIEQVQMLTVLCVGAWIVMTTNALTVGMLVAFNMFASRLAQPVLRIVGLWQEFQQADVAVRRLGDIMDAPAEPYSLMPTRASGGQGPIRIEGLAFRYERDRPFLYENLTSRSSRALHSVSRDLPAVARAHWRSCSRASTSQPKAVSRSTAGTSDNWPPMNCAHTSASCPRRPSCSRAPCTII